MTTHELAEQPCLNCGRPMTAATNADGFVSTPVVGDVTVCLYCGHLMEFGLGLILMVPSDKTIIELAGDPTFAKVMKNLPKAQKIFKEPEK